MRIILSILSVLILALLTFSLTPVGSNVASAIAAQSSLQKNCVALVAAKHNIPNQKKNFTVLTEDFTGDTINDYIVKINDQAACGSAGCIHELCRVDGNTVTYVPFGFASTALTITKDLTQGYADIMLSNGMKAIWNGEQYSFLE